MDWLIPLAQADGAADCGGKAASLGALLRAGFRVPDGFVVTAPAATPSELARLEPAVLQAFGALGAPFVAVRSSAVHEDGQTAAWAGQLDTFLNVSRPQLLDRIRRCMNSAGSARARAYAAQKGLRAGTVAVIVQAMVESEVSGVAFSVHPVTGSREHLVIEAALGLGEAIVSGEATPDTYVIEAASGRVAESLISPQDRQLVRGSGGANEWRNIKPAATGPKLASRQRAELTATVRRLAAFHGFPIDVEWAFADGMLYILQARPITTL